MGAIWLAGTESTTSATTLPEHHIRDDLPFASHTPSHSRTPASPITPRQRSGTAAGLSLMLRQPGVSATATSPGTSALARTLMRATSALAEVVSAPPVAGDDPGACNGEAAGSWARADAVTGEGAAIGEDAGGAAGTETAEGAGSGV